MKCCTQCGIEKRLSEYYFKGKKEKNILQSECKTCFNLRMMRRYELKAKEMIELKGGSCVICGYNTCIAALEFHHMDPSQKDFQISKQWSLSNAKLQAEIDKCVLLCSNCHAEVHYNQTRGEVYNWDLIRENLSR